MSCLRHYIAAYHDYAYVLPYRWAIFGLHGKNAPENSRTVAKATTKTIIEVNIQIYAFWHMLF